MSAKILGNLPLQKKTPWEVPLSLPLLFHFQHKSEGLKCFRPCLSWSLLDAEETMRQKFACHNPCLRNGLHHDPEDPMLRTLPSLVTDWVCSFFLQLAVRW